VNHVYSRIGVPLDGTAEGDEALPWAVGIARRAGCPIEVVRVIVRPTPGPELYGAAVITLREVDDEKAAATAALLRIADQVRASGVDVHTEVLDGEVPKALSDHVHSTGVDLIVMATHDRVRIERVIFGSVTESVTRHAGVPVLIVRHDAPPIALWRILVPLDGSEFARQILPHALTLARLMGGEITLFGVRQPILAVATAALDAGPDPIVPSWHAQTRIADGGSDTTELERTAEDLRRESGLTVHTAMASDGEAARAIGRYAEQHAIDLIAMTTHGRGVLKRLVAGSISHGVLRRSHLPMLVLRPETGE
jgi:nucleotide-binding universal stress UspA family protein